MGKKIKNERKIKPMKKLKVDKISLKRKIKEKLYYYSEINPLNKYGFNYNYEYSKYIREEFNSKIINMILVYLNEKRNLESFPEKFKKEPGFIDKFISLVKYLLLNELEVAALIVLIDNFGWEDEIINGHWNYFCVLGIKAKQLIRSEDLSRKLLKKVRKTNPLFQDYYIYWINKENVVNKMSKIANLKTINEAFIKLSHPTNTYCHINYVNYNGIVDKIIKFTQKYGVHNGNNIKINEDWERIEPEENKRENEDESKDIYNNPTVNNPSLFDLSYSDRMRYTNGKLIKQNYNSSNILRPEDDNVLTMPRFASQSSNDLINSPNNSGYFRNSYKNSQSFSTQYIKNSFI